MDLSTFELHLEPFGNGELPQVRVLIDGRDLIELVQLIELPWARAEGREEIAGGYSGLTPEQWRHLPEQYEDGRAAGLCWARSVPLQSPAI